VEEAHPGWTPGVGARPPTLGARPVPCSAYKWPPPTPRLFTHTFQKTLQARSSRFPENSSECEKVESSFE